jgi:hypothetical protein
MTQHVVILTGGGTPGEQDRPPEPGRMDLALALDRAGVSEYDRDIIMAGRDVDRLTPANARLLAVAAEAFKAGYRQAAMLHRVVAVWVLPGLPAAQRFAAFITAQVDPAYVRTAGDPLPELLAALDNQTGRTIK